MSSIDQAFVKAFARRNRPATPASAKASSDEGSLTVDRSVAQTAQLWVDPVEDQLVRADTPQRLAPQPHVDPPVNQTPGAPYAAEQPAETADAAAHLHTAYAIASLTTETMQSPAKISPWASIAGESAATEAVHPAAPTRQETPADAVPTHQMPVVETRIDSPQQRISANVPADPTEATPTAPPAVPAPTTPAPTTPASDDAVGSSPVAVFRPVWEVDVFDVPETVANLFFDGQLFQQIANRILDAVNTGLSSVLVTSARAGEGRSTVAIGIAMAAAAAGIRVALVDADTEAPTLLDDLGIDLEYGWVDTIRGGLPIEEVAVHAIEDGVTLIPLMPPHGHTAATAYEVTQLVSLLKSKFDLVILDGPVGTSPTIGECATATESAIIVRDVQSTHPEAISEFSNRLRKSGLQGIGVVENFA